MIKVLFFAKLSEQLGVRELLVEMNDISNTDQLFEYLLNYKIEWAASLKGQTWLMAVNQTMTTSNQALKSGDEVAFFPPVTGG